MLTQTKLEEMKIVDICAVDKDTLADVSRVKLDNSLPKNKRMALPERTQTARIFKGFWPMFVP